MDAIINFLNQPIILTFLTLTIGGYLFKWLGDRRARKDTIRDKTIELLTEIGQNINSATSRLFFHINREDPQVWQHKTLTERLDKLISNRMGIRVRSEAYLESPDFYKKYEYIVWELYYVRDTIAALSKEYDLEQIMIKIQQREKSLNELIPLEDEKLNQRGKPPYSEIFIWTQMIVNRSAALLSSNLKAALK